jgi:hypothetical protein
VARLLPGPNTGARFVSTPTPTKFEVTPSRPVVCPVGLGALAGLPASPRAPGRRAGAGRYGPPNGLSGAALSQRGAGGRYSRAFCSSEMSQRVCPLLLMLPPVKITPANSPWLMRSWGGGSVLVANDHPLLYQLVSSWTIEFR